MTSCDNQQYLRLDLMVPSLASKQQVKESQTYQQELTVQLNSENE